MLSAHLMLSFDTRTGLDAAALDNRKGALQQRGASEEASCVGARFGAARASASGRTGTRTSL
jgi:hypothetical protein